MQWRRQLRTNRLLWAACAIGVFTLLGFFDPLPGTKGHVGSFWGWVAIGVREEIGLSDWVKYGGYILCWAAMYIQISVFPGWVIQAVIVAMRSLACGPSEQGSAEPLGAPDRGGGK